MTNTLIDYLQTFQDLPLADQKLIASYFEFKTLKEGDGIFEGGRVCRQLFFVCAGVLRIVKLNEKGDEVTHFFVKENQFCTILHSFENEVLAEEGIRAACNAAVLIITKTRLLELYQQVPYLKPLIDQIIQQRLLAKVRTRNNYLGEDSASRYRLFVAQEPEIASRVALKDAASYLGITPQSLSRIRKNINK